MLALQLIEAWSSGGRRCASGCSTASGAALTLRSGGLLLLDERGELQGELTSGSGPVASCGSTILLGDGPGRLLLLALAPGEAPCPQAVPLEDDGHPAACIAAREGAFAVGMGRRAFARLLHNLCPSCG